MPVRPNPFGGITRIRFWGYNLSSIQEHPFECYLTQIYK